MGIEPAKKKGLKATLLSEIYVTYWDVYIYICILYTGWWLTYPSAKYEFVSWDYYFQYMEKYNKKKL